MADRRTKFRIWNPDLQAMDYDFIMNADGHIYGFDKNYMADTPYESPHLMMRIEIKDQKLRSVYEGDIVSYIDSLGNPSIGEVKYIKEKAYFFLEKKDGSGDSVGVLNSSNFDILGTVYENPELLK